MSEFHTWLKSQTITPDVMARIIEIHEFLDLDISPPIATPTMQGGMHLAWSREGFYLEIDIIPTGRFKWFFIDRNSKSTDGTEICLECISETLLERMKLIS